jgi:hypothetical protein
MSARVQISALIYMMVQAVMFGVGTLLVLTTPFQTAAMQLMPWVVVVSSIISLPVSWGSRLGFAPDTGVKEAIYQISSPVRKFHFARSP